MAELTLKVTDIGAPAPAIRAVQLVTADATPLPGFRAGAHIRVFLPDGGHRHYSLMNLASTPDATAAPTSYRLGVLLEQNGQGGSAYMHALKIGDTISTSAPNNDFPLAQSPAHSVLIAGGIGVTPITSMAAELRAAGRPFALHYSGRSRTRLAFVDEIEALCQGACTVYCDDEPEHRLDLRALIASLTVGDHIYVCGPRGMIEAARELAAEMGHSRDHVHFELFSTPKDQAGDTAFEVEIGSTGQVVVVPADRTIIQALEAEGLDLIYDCQRGDCGICQTGVLAGVPDHRDVVLTDRERAANTVMQICVSRAKTDRLVLDL